MNKQHKYSSQVIASNLKDKLDKIKEKEAQIKSKIKNAENLTKHKKEIEQNRHSINEIGSVSEIIKTADGKIIGYSFKSGGVTIYYDKNRRMLAKEMKSGTYSANGKLVSYQAIGLVIVGLSLKISKKQRA
jgi:hypothetical protein